VVTQEVVQSRFHGLGAKAGAPKELFVDTKSNAHAESIGTFASDFMSVFSLIQLNAEDGVQKHSMWSQAFISGSCNVESCSGLE
jgi:hypothetical protein